MGHVLRRAVAHRGLLGLVVLLVAVVAAAGGTTAGAVAGTTGAAAQRALTVPETASLQVTTRLADDAESQDAHVRQAVARLLAGAPVAVDRAQRPDGADTSFVVWTLTPEVAAVTPDDLPVLADGGAALHQELRSDDAVAVRGLTVEGDLAERAARQATATATAGSAVGVPVSILTLVALAALAQVARLLSGARQRELEIVVARGAAPSRLVVADGVEAVGVALCGALAGTAAAAVLLEAGDVPGGADPVALVATGAVTASTAVVVLVVTSAVRACAVARRQGGDRAGRLRQIAGVGGVLAVVALAALGVLRWRTLGSPVVVDAEGVRADLPAVLAPALVLAATGMVALAVLGPATRVWSAAAARSRGATAVLASRQVSRGLRVVAVPVVLLVLSGGATVLAAASVATTTQARDALAAQRVGTDVRVALPGDGRLDDARPAPAAHSFARLDGASGAAPVLVEDATVDGDPLRVTALPVGLADGVVRADDVAALTGPLGPGERFDRAPALGPAAELALDLTGAAVPAAGSSPMSTPPATAGGDGRAEVAVAVWLAADDGTLTVLEAGTVALGAEATVERVTIDVPVRLTMAPGLRLVAVDVDPRVGAATDLEVGLRDVVATDGAGAAAAADLTAAAWTAVAPASGEVLVPETPGPPSVRTTAAPGGAAGVRFVVARDVAGDPATTAATVPATLTRAAAERWDASPGDVLEATVAGSGVRLEVAGLVDRVPGGTAADAALVDLGTLDAVLLRTAVLLPRPAEVWVGADHPDDDESLTSLVTLATAQARVQAPDPEDFAVTTASGAVRGPGSPGTAPDTSSDAGAPVRLAAVTAAAGSGVLALVGLAVAAAVGLGSRRGETVVLRAVGVGPRGQGAGRALEIAVVGVAGVVSGLVGGLAVAALTVPGLAQGVVGSAVVPAFAVDVPLLAVLTGVALLGVAATAAVVAGRVAAQVRDTAYRPEVR